MSDGNLKKKLFVLFYEYLKEMSSMRSFKFLGGQHKICYGRKENMIIKRTNN